MFKMIHVCSMRLYFSKIFVLFFSIIQHKGVPLTTECPLINGLFIKSSHPGFLWSHIQSDVMDLNKIIQCFQKALVFFCFFTALTKVSLNT